MSARPAHAFRLSGFMPPRSRRGANAASHRGIVVLMAFFLGLMWLSTGNGPVAIVGSAAAADSAVGAGAWLAEEVRGTVLVRAAGEAAGSWQPLQAATPVAGQSEIATGSDGVAVLNNGVDHIRLAPNSRLVLPPDQHEGLLTVIQQSLGKIFFEVGPRPDRSFEVDAPYLVVLVKGTQFTVTANYMGNSVAVKEGTVEVRTTGGGEAKGTLITAGQTASVVAGGGSIRVESSETSDGDGSGPGKGGSEPQSNLPRVRNAKPEPPGDEGDGGETGGSDGDGGGDQSGDGGDRDPGGDGDGGGDQSGDGGDHDPGGDGDGGGDQSGDGGDHDPGGDGEGGGGHGCGSGHSHSGDSGD